MKKEVTEHGITREREEKSAWMMVCEWWEVREWMKTKRRWKNIYKDNK